MRQGKKELHHNPVHELGLTTCFGLQLDVALCCFLVSHLFAVRSQTLILQR